MERQPSFSRIIGGTEEQRNAFKEEVERRAAISGEEYFGEELLDPTEEEKDLIAQAVAYANSLAASYGSTRVIDPQRIFILRDGAVLRLTDGNINGGIHNRLQQTIGVERKISPIVLAMTIVHEACHGASYSSAQILKDGTDQAYRHGIAMREIDGNGTYFSQAEEAIVTIFSRRFHDEVLAHDPRYQEDINRIREIKAWLGSFIKRKAPIENQKDFLSLIDDVIDLPDNEKLYEMIVTGSQDEDYVFGYFQAKYHDVIKSGAVLRERSKERLVFDQVLDRITQQSGETITKDELFTDFAKAHFTGNYIPLAKKVEKCMGKGSFRDIAKELGEFKTKVT